MTTANGDSRRAASPSRNQATSPHRDTNGWGPREFSQHGEVTRAALRWARKTLELPEQPHRDRDAIAILKLLQQQEFAVTSDVTQAINLVTDRPTETWAFLNEDEPRCRKLLQEFVADYFRLTPRKRRERFADLEPQVDAHPFLRHRLQTLREGLDVDTTPLRETQPHVQSLGELVTQRFLATPDQAAVMTDRWKTAWPISQRRAAAKTLQKNFADIAALDEQFVRHSSQSAKKQIEEAKRRAAEIRRKQQTQPVESSPSSAPSAAEQVTGYGLPVIIGIALTVVLRLMNHSDRDQPRLPTAPYQSTAELDRLRQSLRNASPESLESLRTLLDERRSQRDSPPNLPDAKAPAEVADPFTHVMRLDVPVGRVVVYRNPDGTETVIPGTLWDKQNVKRLLPTDRPIHVGPIPGDAGPPHTLMLRSGDQRWFVLNRSHSVAGNRNTAAAVSEPAIAESPPRRSDR